jgi:uncharacterized protein
MLQDKETRLRAILREMRSCILAFSGGVDSACLALIAHQELGEAAFAITAESPSYPTHQKRIAEDLVRERGFRHEFVASAELEDANDTANPSNRCYSCKHELYSLLKTIATARGHRFVVDGNNLDDTVDCRHGRQAGAELEVRSPLLARGEMQRAMTTEIFDTLSGKFKRIGSLFVALDLEGYRTGALNEVLTQIRVPTT